MYHLTSNFTFLANFLLPIRVTCKMLLAAILSALFATSASASTTVGQSSEFSSGPNATWTNVITLATVSDGASSQGEQTLSINVTELPANGANYRVYKTTENGNDFLGNAQSLSLGENNITVGAVEFDRTVKIQLSTPDIGFDALSVNEIQLYPVILEGGPAITVGESSAFIAGPNETWTNVITLATVSDGASSQGEQTLSITVTELPANGANYRVYKTTENGNDFFGNAQSLGLGDNNISVGAVGFNRAVKIQLSSSEVKFNNLSVNGTQLYPIELDDSISVGGSIAPTMEPAAWTNVITLANTSDGASSQSEQTLTINVTELPEGGANYRVYKTTENGNDFFGNSIALGIGENTISVAAVPFERTVKVQLSSPQIQYNLLTINKNQFYPMIESDDQDISIGGSSLFEQGPNETWTNVITLARAADGNLSQSTQTLNINVTGLPTQGANYRVYKTVFAGNDYFGDATTLFFGENIISVSEVDFDRTVKIQLSSSDVRFDTLSINGAQQYPSEGNWDFDNDGFADALTDGLLLLRYAFGLTGDALVASAISESSPLTPEQVEANVATSITSFADIDDSGNVDALTDGLLLLRYLFGLTGDTLIASAVAENANRASALDIEAYISDLYP